MRLGVHRDELVHALTAADRVWLYQPANLGWDLDAVAAALAGKASVAHELPRLVESLAAELRTGDDVVIMSNGGFGGLHDKLLQALATAR